MRETVQQISSQERVQRHPFRSGREVHARPLPETRSIPGFSTIYMAAAGTIFSPHMRYARRAGALGDMRERHSVG